MEVNCSAYVLQVNPQGRASQTGLQQGDEVVAICHTDVTRMAHNEVKREILRAGNELDLTVRRYIQNIGFTVCRFR